MNGLVRIQTRRNVNNSKKLSAVDTFTNMLTQFSWIVGPSVYVCIKWIERNLQGTSGIYQFLVPYCFYILTEYLKHDATL